MLLSYLFCQKLARRPRRKAHGYTPANFGRDHGQDALEEEQDYYYEQAEMGWAPRCSSCHSFTAM